MFSKFLPVQSNDDANQKELVKPWGSSWLQLTLKQRELVGEILKAQTPMKFDSKLIELLAQEVSAQTGLFHNPWLTDKTRREGRLSPQYKGISG